MNTQVWDAAVIGWRRLAQRPGVFVWERHGDADCFWWTGSPGKIAHQLFLSTPTAETLTNSVHEALQTRRDGGDVCLRILDREDLAAALDAFHPKSSNTAPLLLCDLAHRPAAPPSEFRTAIIGGVEERARLLRMVGGVYDDPDGLTGFFHGAGEIVGVFDGDRLVSSATVVPAGDTANIWSVATAQEERGRGAASVVVVAALDRAAAAGCSYAGLGTSDELVGWYGRFGFAEVGRERSAVLSRPSAT
ncbi:GNAT family N-acetyltransferase [Kribbella sp.]|uniref:GNAT family N-acetyltransferase n=1 Tax=Kribbella sp. TaxID=1871183 RepID=UPI002D21FD8C|nr:GNAT family N-acetyltransferase [Kribbella sp.]HZX02460.1 GNAT family N-acetyltransferase [Kribbella sp.]